MEPEKLPTKDQASPGGSAPHEVAVSSRHSGEQPKLPLFCPSVPESRAAVSSTLDSILTRA